MGLLGKLWVKLGLDSSEYKKGINNADKATTSFKDRLKTIGQAVGVAFGVAAIVQFGRKVIQTRGEFESLEISFRTLLKSKSAADALMAQMVDLAARTPFSLQQVATGAKQLLAYGFAASEVRGTMSKLGDVAAGLGLPMERLTYLYGTTRTQGRLFARDLMQFTTSGIPMLDELAKMFGKSTEEINKMVSAGDIGFEEVKQVFSNMTGESGKFYNMMEERSKGISGKISNLGDAISVMFNNIGKSQEGPINSALSGAKFLVENYQSVLDILKSLIATYGVYKAASIVSNSIQKISDRVTYEAEMSALQKLIPVKMASKNADIEEAMAKGRLSKASAERLIAIRAEAAAELDRLKVVEKALVAKVAVAAEENAIALQQALSAERRERTAREELSQAVLSGNAQQIRRAEIKLTLAEEELNIALKNKEIAANTLVATSTKAKSAATAVDTMQTKVNTVATRSATTAKNLFTAATARLTKAFHSLKVAFATNPIGIILTGVALAISAFSTFSDSTNEASQELTGLEKATKDAGEEFGRESAKIQALQDVMTNSKVAYDERKRALNELRTIIPQYNGELTKEGQIINNNTTAIKDYLVQLEKQIKMKAAQGELEEAYKQQRLLQKDYDLKYKDWSSKNTNSAYHDKPVIDILGHFGGRDLQKAEKAKDAAKQKLIDIEKTISSLNTEIEKTSTYAANATKSFRPLSKVIEEIKTNKKQLAAIDPLKINTDAEYSAYQALKDERDKLAAEYKTFEDEGFGAKVKVETDKDKDKEALLGSIAYLEELLSKEQLKLKLAVTDAERTKAQAAISGIQAEIDVKLNVSEAKSERQTIEDAIKGYADLQTAIPIGMGTPEELQAAQAEWDRLSGLIKQAREELEKFPKTTEIFPEGSLDYFDAEIAKITGKLGSMGEAERAAAQAALAMLEVQKKGAESGWKTKLEQEIELLDLLKKALEQAGGAQKEYLQNAVDAQQIVVDNLDEKRKAITQFNEDISAALIAGATAAVVGLGTALGELAMGGSGGDVWATLLAPIADMAIQLGEIAISTGIAMLGIKAAFKSMNPYAAIAAGVALVALGTIVKGAISNMSSKGKGSSGGGGNNNTFTGGYSNGSSSSSRAMQFAPQKMEVVVTGEIDAGGMRVALLKEEQRRLR